MPEYTDESSQIKETDLVFDCPHCGKSLAIDYRGAGLNIQCTDCGRNVQVPIPEGMEISDLDSSVEEQEIRILNLRKALASAEERINQLEHELESIRRERLEASAENTQSAENVELKTALEQVAAIRDMQAEIMALLKDNGDK